MSIREKLKRPYWAHEDHTTFPGSDYCRELVLPGTSTDFPDGAVGIRVDEDFWAVAVLPYTYKTWTCEEIVRDLWPNDVVATFWSDSGSLEQKVEFLEREVYFLRRNEQADANRIRQLEQKLRRWSMLAPPRSELEGK